MQRSRDIYDCHFLPQAHYVFGLDGKRTCDHVLRFSTLATDFRHLMRSHNLSNGLLSVKAAAALYNAEAHTMHAFSHVHCMHSTH